MGRMGTLQVDCHHPALSNEYERITRRLLERGDTLPPQPTVAPSHLHPEAIRMAAGNWRRRMVQEHRSASVFAGMIPDLIEAELGVDLKMCVLRSAMDELFHSDLCGRVAHWLDGSNRTVADLEAEPLARHPGVPPVERSLRNLLFVGCLSETVAVSILTAERDEVEDPYVDAVLKRLAGDETLHARLGWILLRDLWPTLDADARRRTNDYLGVALAYYEQVMLDATPVQRIPPEILRDAQKLGFAECSMARDLLYETLESVILPQLQDIGLDAQKAWNARACGPGIAGPSTVFG